MHDDDLRNPRRIGSRVSFLAGKRKVKQCVVLRRRRVLVLRLVALGMAFKNVRKLLLINHNDGFMMMMMNLLFCTTSLYRKTSTFRMIRTPQFDLEELVESESFAEFRFIKRDIRILKEVLQISDMITCSQRSVCDGLEGLYAVQAAFIAVQIWRYEP